MKNNSIKRTTVFRIATILLLSITWQWSDAQIIKTIAGDSIAGYLGDGAAAINAKLNAPYSIAVDAHENVYIADYNNNRIRKINTLGIISTVAGDSTEGYSGDGGIATAAELNLPYSVAVDTTGNIYIGDTYNNVIRKINKVGIISTIAGNSTQGYAGDGSSATTAELFFPTGVAVDDSGNVYICDYGNSVIRKVNTFGIINTIAGNGAPGFLGDGGAATNAELNYPIGVAVDTSGNVYIADNDNSAIRKVNKFGIINTIAGNATAGYLGDGGIATAAELSFPTGVTVDVSGNMYISDAGNSVIRKVNPSGTISTFAGNGTFGFSGDGGIPTIAQLNDPTNVAFDAIGNMYIVDRDNNRIREITGITGINELNDVAQINIYPNPSNGQLTINLTNNNCTKITIYDVLGRAVYSENFSTAQNNIHLNLYLTDGIYMLKLASTKDFITKRIEIEK